jgi:hypothetical protein
VTRVSQPSPDLAVGAFFLIGMAGDYRCRSAANVRSIRRGEKLGDAASAGKIYIKLNDGRVGGDVTTLFPSPRNAGRSGGGDRRSLSGRLLARARGFDDG